MDTGKTYYDTEGNECSIWQMVMREPHWAANRIQEGEKALEEIARLRAEAKALQKRNDALVDLSNHVDKLYRDAKAEAEANRVDAERLNSKKIKIDSFDEFGERVTVLHIGIDLRAAIDAARGKDNG